MIARLASIAAMLFAAAAPAQMPAVGSVALAAPSLPGTVALPVSAALPDRETWFRIGNDVTVRNVTRPSLTPFLPAPDKATGAAVIVAPGGGFSLLAIENEGWKVARWLADHGVAAFVLRYRVLPTAASQADYAAIATRQMRGEKVGSPPPEDTPPEALADGVAALRYVRAHARDYGVDPKRVGFMSFSAGGFLTRSIVARGGPDLPAFAGPIYPNMAAIAVPADAPPMFVAVAADDFLLARVRGFPLVESYRAAGRPIEFHLFASGGHGFGPGVPGTPTEGWLDLYLRWLRTQHLLDGAK